MYKSKQRSLSKVGQKPRILPLKKRQIPSKVKPKTQLKSSKNPLKKPVRRSPLMRAALQPTILGNPKQKPQVKSKVTFKKSSRKAIEAPSPSMGIARRTKLVDARPQKRGGTPVLFLVKDSKAQQAGKKKKPSPVSRSPKVYRMDPRRMSRVETTTAEGVDFFYHLGQKMKQPMGRDQRFRSAGFEGRLAGGGATRSARNRTGVSSVIGNATGVGKDVVVPLSSRLPIIDFISTNEFHNMYPPRNRKQRSALNG
ncbi:uncharacterized protein LOC108098013 [Drosophila ficusphila]|uniref:uncharacterized protein LOC108098013 n=1 Tax=Drosophila ficusphila TaxID=30025 RepID=UPI0007E6D217|nr:uncharacterized protein LOC108098013 [Drosophila ficusphila]